jgi:8-oxo-dGTP pyrophosphatase MutT (NUDIX family)
MLDLKPDREPTIPADAATVVLARDGEAGLEIFCVERSKQSRFLGGAIVFP